mgnify:CR=1 FL=1
MKPTASTGPSGAPPRSPTSDRRTPRDRAKTIRRAVPGDRRRSLSARRPRATSKWGLLPGQPVGATPSVDEEDRWLRHGRRRSSDPDQGCSVWSPLRLGVCGSPGRQHPAMQFLNGASVADLTYNDVFMVPSLSNVRLRRASTSTSRRPTASSTHAPRSSSPTRRPSPGGGYGRDRRPARRHRGAAPGTSRSTSSSSRSSQLRQSRATRSTRRRSRWPPSSTRSPAPSGLDPQSGPTAPSIVVDGERPGRSGDLHPATTPPATTASPGSTTS